MTDDPLIGSLSGYLTLLAESLGISNISEFWEDPDWRTDFEILELDLAGIYRQPFFDNPDADDAFSYAVVLAQMLEATRRGRVPDAECIEHMCGAAYFIGRRMARVEIHQGPESIFELANRARVDRAARARGAELTQKTRAQSRARDKKHAEQLAKDLVAGDLPTGKRKWTLTLLAEEVGTGWKLETPRPSVAAIRSMLKERGPELIASGA